ncbi:MAG: histidinol dehydrogenase, partial [Verrucomicrobia bacterium]|nr:histidinol dehydrogenase [Verrucomicrobiota bacterium]
MKLIDLRQRPFERWKAELDRRYEPAPELVAAVAEILADIRARGDAAVADYSKRFDGVDVTFTESGFQVTEEEIRSALGHLDPRVGEALETAKANVQEFARRSRRTDWVGENAQGATVGER